MHTHSPLNLLRFQTFLTTGLLALLLGFSQSALSAVFDAFTEVQVASDVIDGGSGDSQSTATGIGSIVGGQRDINANALSGSDDVGGDGACTTGDKCSVLAISGGTLRFNNDTGLTGTGIVQWDGPDQDIALVEDGIGIDLSATQLGFELTVLEADQPSQITLEAYSNSAAYTIATIDIPAVPAGSPLALTIAFADLETCTNTGGFAALECAPGDVPVDPVSYTHLTLPTKESRGRSRWWGAH